MRKYNFTADFEKIINFTGLLSIGVFCFLYSMYTAAIAERHVTIPGLGLPIFVGEMLLFWCMALVFIKWWGNGFVLDRYILALGIYILWILIKALGPGGYFGGYGALAFRNAALFYYILFGVLGYSFFDRRFFTPARNFFSMVLLGLMLYLEMVNDYYWVAYVFLFFLLALHAPKRWIAYASLAAGLIFFTWRTLLFGSSRAHLIGVSAVAIFFFLNIVFVFLPFRLKYKWLALAGLTVIFCLAIYRFADPNAIKSLTTPSRVIAQFKEWDAFIKDQGKNFVLPEIPVNLYNPDQTPIKAAFHDYSLVPHWGQKKTLSLASDIQKKIAPVLRSPEVKVEKAVSIEKQEFTPAPAETEKNVTAMERIEKVMQDTSADGLTDQTRYRSLGIAYGNMHFRLFIWRDMIEELLAEPKNFILGIGFGKPQRSRSIEIIGWGKLEWRRTGWITPHNSYLHMIYRGGVVGIVVIIAIFVLLVRMTRIFAQKKSMTGTLLVTILVYWMVFAFFSIFWEVPYTAIPFWTLFGITLAYAHEQVRDFKEKVTL